MRIFLVFVAIVIGGCATAMVPSPAPVPAPAPPQAPAPVVESGFPPPPAPVLPPPPEYIPPPTAVPIPPPPRADNIVVAGLMERAHADAAAGRLTNAAASLERGLRIDPRNARLWHELARVRLKQRDYAQAESTAARSNSWAGDDPALRAENWRLIAQAREARGDAAGARAATDAAAQQK